MYKIVDVEKWNRRVPYRNFIGYTDPIFSVGARLDVTELFASSKRRHTSFFSDFAFLISKCLNAVEELRLRIVDGKVVMYDRIDPNYIVMTDGGVICPCRTRMTDGYPEFYAQSRADIDRVRRNGGGGVFNCGDNGVFYMSCLKWLDFASISNPYDHADADGSSIPRLTWGKAVAEGDRVKMSFDIAAHHALVDGEPVCRGINMIADALMQADEFLGVNNK